MDNSFEIEVLYNNKPLVFPAQLVASSFNYRIIVDIHGVGVSFEPDEERKFRAVVNYDQLDERNMPAKSLLEEIANSLISMFKD